MIEFLKGEGYEWVKGNNDVLHLIKSFIYHIILTYKQITESYQIARLEKRK